MANDSRYTNQRQMWQNEMDNVPTSRPYAIMFETLPVGSLSLGLAGESIKSDDPLKFNERGLFVVTIEANAVAVAQQNARRGSPVSVQKVK